MTALVTHSDIRLVAAAERVVGRLFVPGHELLMSGSESRATGVLARILALPDEVVAVTLERVMSSYAPRHRDLPGLLRDHFARIEHRVPPDTDLTEQRRQLIGAMFTAEVSLEGAALFNPSIVEHPDQTGLAPGEHRFVLSLRAVGEGHVSCIEFRTGVLGPGDHVRVDPPGSMVETGHPGPTPYDRAVFAHRLAEEGADAESASYLVRCLPPRFLGDDLERALTALHDQRVTRHGASHTDELARRVYRCTYEVEFSPDSAVSGRVLWPHGPSETHGMEDARFVRFLADGGPASYLATYTAFDGQQIVPQLIETADFRTFRMSQLAGPAAKNKGLALFPRPVAGRYLALSRWDRENLAICASRDGFCWENPRTVHAPSQPWELIQTGNCGSPVETAAGWLVLTHGVGPMREYAIGALLLDLEDPRIVIGGLDEPLLRPTPDDRDGYVPNVVYACGALLQGDRLLLPYGVNDSSVRFAFVDVPLLLARLTRGSSPATTRAKRPA